MSERDNLICKISRVSDKYGDKLVEFMNENGLKSLSEATTEQLKKYVEMKGI